MRAAQSALSVEPAGLPLGVRLGLFLYGLAWRATLPGLKRNKRLAEGWSHRVLAEGPPPQADLWVQAASGGEAYLAWEMLRNLLQTLAEALPNETPTVPRVLVTTFTSQGLGVLEQAREELAGRVDIIPAYFPFDLPSAMRRVLAAVRPKAMVLLETELWPGLLGVCRQVGVPVLVLNGRMTEKSAHGYTRLPWLWKAMAPARVLAVSIDDASRFARVFGSQGVGVMDNIKFDRLRFDAPPVTSEMAPLLPPGAPFVVLGSVRKEEETEVLNIVRGLLSAKPRAVIGLFPRHMQRVCVWERLLGEANIPFALRSETTTPVAPGTVLIGDVFGEMGAAFSLAAAVFLGGSLAPLGGQNFLEPLAFGVSPVTGPHWSNFAWVGEDIFEHGLVLRAQDWQGALRGLLERIDTPPDRTEIRNQAKSYAHSRQGGGQAACQAVAECLINA